MIHSNKIFILSAILFAAITVSCDNSRKRAVSVMDKAGENKTELQKVIVHYTKTEEKEKLKAAYFLIANMENKYSVAWHNRNQYQSLFDSARTGVSNAPMRTVWDSLKTKSGIFKEKIKDIETITAEHLITNIDLAFYAWKSIPWGKHYNFDQFCRYILPYRADDEPLDNWRPYLFEKMKWFMDSLHKKSDMREACKYLNDYVDKHHRLLPVLSEMPKLETIDAFNNPAGICEHRLILIVNMLRTFGIPCALDYTPQYTNWAGGHLWIALIDTTGNTISFNGGDKLVYPAKNKIPMGGGKWEATKVYRATFEYDNSFYKEKTYKVLFDKPHIYVTN